MEIYCIKCKRRKPFNEKITSTCCTNLIRSLITFSDYENKIISDLIKYGKVFGYRKIFEFFGYVISKEILKIDRKNLEILKNFKISYIPLHINKAKLRGFNHTKILGETISKNVGLEIFDGLIKIRDTKLQTELNYEERLKNLESAFICIKKPPNNILLVDDVTTTGATLFECAKTLKESGCKNIIALTIAK